MKHNNQKMVVILGAGGHGQVAADILQSNEENKFEFVGYLDDNPRLNGQTISGKKVLGPINDLSTIKHESVFVAVGDNKERALIFNDLLEKGEDMINLIHPDAVVAPDVELGKGIMICAGVIINPGSIIRNNIILNTGCSIDHHNQIEDHVHIAPGAVLGGDVQVKEGSLVGMGSIITPQQKIGPWSIVGAGACVTENVPAGHTVVGVPAKSIKKGN